MKKCTRCGWQMKDEASFCPKCGQPMGASVQPAQKKKILPFILALVLVFLLACAATAIAVTVVRMKKNSPVLEKIAALETESVSEEENTGLKEEETEEKTKEQTTAAETEAETQEETTPAEPEEPADPLASKNEGNTVGNEHCFGRMVSDGTRIYYRNSYDDSKLYAFKKDGSGMFRLLDERVKDLHMIGDWIYYSGEDDNNLFKIKTDGSEKRKLTNIQFPTQDSGCSFETIVDGKLYYLYGGGPSYGTDISEYDEDTGSIRTIAHINPDQVTNRISPNIVEDQLYYQQADGIYRCGLDGSNVTRLVPDLVCHEFLMAKGYIYYVTAPGDPAAPQYIGRVKLDGTGMETLAEASAGGYMKLNIYKDKLYYISGYPVGNLSVMELDGSGKKTFPYVLDWYNIIDGRIYMNSRSQDNEWLPLYSCDSDGNNVSEVFDVEPFKSQAAGNGKAGWAASGADWYYYNQDGTLRTGWLQDAGSQYYLESDGKMKLGLWLVDESKKKGYYFDETGRMQTGSFTFNMNGQEKRYTFYQDGTYSEG